MARLPRLILLVGLALVTTCGGDDAKDAPEAEGRGTLRVTLASVPSGRADQVFITVDGVSAHHLERGWLVVDDAVRTVDVERAAIETLGAAALPAGRYDAIRLHVREGAVYVAGDKHALEVPAPSDDGIELAADFTVATCGLRDVTLGWDLSAHLAESAAAGYTLSPTLSSSTTLDESACCGARLCAGGTCDPDGCTAGGGEQLVVFADTAGLVAGIYGNDGNSLSFIASETAARKALTLLSASGAPLVDVSWEGTTFRTALLGGGMVTTVDLAILEESKRLATLPPDQIPADFTLDGAIVVTGDRTLAETLVALPEYALLPHLSRALGGAGYDGQAHPETLPLHRMAMQAAKDLDVVPAPLSMPRSVDEAGGACTDLRPDPNDDDCFGMCGYGCSCWEWVCGDCCCNEGCRTHDKSCRECKWYKPWNCLLCATGLSFLAGTCGSCAGGGGVHEPTPCMGLGEACSADHDCCGHDDGASEERGPYLPTVICLDGACHRDGVTFPPPCGNGTCGGGEDCASCRDDCGACPGSCGDGVCDGGGEDCASCSADCGLCPSTCGNGTCDPGLEDACTCAFDCPPVCGNGVCDCGENCATCPSECGTCPSTCGNGSCDAGEDCTWCSGDCGVCPPSCGDGACNGAETCATCVGDCGACPPSCGDGSCNGGETCSSCPGDCGGCPASCGDGSCNGGESCSSCPGDCGGCPMGCGDGSCAPGVEDNCTCPSDCPPVCGNGTCDCAESCSSCPSECGACPPVCGDGSCEPVLEDCGNCPGDCPCWMPGTACFGGMCLTYCGNGTCDSDEWCDTCPGDCGGCCGNGSCDFGEDGCTCGIDCGPCLP